MTLHYESKLGVTAVLLAAFMCGACSANDRETGTRTPGTSSGSGNNSATSGSSFPDLDNGSNIDVDPNLGLDPSDDRELPVREKVCDDSGNCTCLRLALLGTLESKANNKDTKPFTDWLNGKSNGTATVTMVSTKPNLDAEFLDKYDILLIANVNQWSFSSGEKAAVEQWVREKGGGIIALSGFESTDTEPNATSQLISFSGIRFKSPMAAENGQQIPVYYQGGTTDLKNCLSWTGSSEAIITTPVKFTSQDGLMSKLTHELDYVGAMVGWGIEAPADATIIATDPVSKQPIAVAKEIDGKGRVFAFGDEWVLFANQWAPVGQAHNQQKDEYNPCWQPPKGNEEGYFHSVKSLYQTKQFWYDAINWVAPPNECSFVVVDNEVVPILR